MSQIEVPPLPKLPLGETISLSYAWFFQKFTDVLRLSWIWIAICAVLMGSLGWLQATLITPEIAATANGLPHSVKLSSPSGAIFGPLIVLADIIFFVAPISMAVAWHRRILLGERPHLSGSNIFTAAFWRYLGIGLLIGLVIILPIFAVVLVPALVIFSGAEGTAVGHPSAGLLLILPVIFVLYIAGMAVFLRLSPLLPARAVGNLTANFRDAWVRTRGNTWRMFWGMIACTLPPMIVMQIVILVLFAAIGPITADPVHMLAGMGVIMAGLGGGMTALYLLIIPIYIGFLSHSYRHFFQGGIEAAG